MCWSLTWKWHLDVFTLTIKAENLRSGPHLHTCEYTTKWLTISLPSSRANVNGHHWDKNTASCFCTALNMLKYSTNAQISTGIDFLHEKINITHSHFKELKADIKPVTLVPVKKLYVWQVIVKALCVFLSLRKFCRTSSMAINQIRA